MRVPAIIIIFIVIIIGPYWLYLPAIILGIIFFPLFLEAIPLALLADILYGHAGTGLAWGFPFGMIAALAVFLASPLREYLRFNA
jgi:hypothetical protein